MEMNKNPCTVQPIEGCDGCSLTGRLMCRYEARDTTHFLMIILPFFVTTISGVIISGYGWWLTVWLAYMLFFFFVWEGRVLCSHCPYWAERGRVLHCHANYGVIKLWQYHPGPMNRSEQVQFLVGALLFILYPLVFLVIGREYLLAAIGLACATSFAYLLRRNICNCCVNFSCPLNNVPKDIADIYLLQNPAMRMAWGKRGYQLSS
jgi:hypothetical protein